MENELDKMKGLGYGLYMLTISSLANILTDWLGVATAVIGIVSGIKIIQYYHFKTKNERLDYVEKLEETKE